MVFCLLIFLDFLHGEEQQGGRRETRRMGSGSKAGFQGVESAGLSKVTTEN